MATLSMNSMHCRWRTTCAVALTAVLGTFAWVATTVAHAESQFEWLDRQLQITDGYAPTPVPSARPGERVAPVVRRVASGPASVGRSAPRAKRVSQQHVKALVPPAAAAPPEARAVGEPEALPSACADCVSSTPLTEIDSHREDMGVAALGALLLLAAFKVMRVTGAFQHAWEGR